MISIDSEVETVTLKRTNVKSQTYTKTTVLPHVKVLHTSEVQYYPVLRSMRLIVHPDSVGFHLMFRKGTLLKNKTV